MANDFDEFPVYDEAVNRDLTLSGVWRGALSTFFQTLIGYLTQYGIFMPQLTTEQRDSIQSPIDGQLIYNTSLNTAQYFKAGAWVNI